MRPDLEIALIWIVREYGPINASEIATRAYDTTDAPLAMQLLKRFPTLLNPRYLAQDLEKLVKRGLLQRVGEGDFSSNSPVVVAPIVGELQGLFGISLSDMVSSPNARINAYPVFGFPSSALQKWAEIFVAMPFRAELKPIYDPHILNIAAELGLTCKRGDDFSSSNAIMQEVWSAIYNARLCIVDCTGNNPNVFYELGIAHTLGRKCILLTQSKADFPFDVQALRHIVYENSAEGLVQLETQLRQSIRAELNLK